MSKVFAFVCVFFLGLLIGQFIGPKRAQERPSLVTTLSEDTLSQSNPYGDQEQVVARESLTETGIEETNVALPSFAWVTVQVEDAKNGNGVHKVGENCSVKEGGSVKSTAFGTSDKVLVTYQYPKQVPSSDWNQGGEGYGAQCGNGTLFLMSKTVFSRLRDSTITR